ncbi:hypothetical protein [Nocardia sp. alder85J]|uniref:hypothetical protein n=1 Tax=Nocardia sp. alder85J TaxID=2862949 RepID=UPI002258501E|nr:hypothetical protein [Nocardia sp. alder85J]MCX4097678.1 hypothetical protein [Nocardia sp. alder85J]
MTTEFPDTTDTAPEETGSIESGAQAMDPAAAGRPHPGQHMAGNPDPSLSRPDLAAAPEESAEAWGDHMAGLLGEWLHLRTASERAGAATEQTVAADSRDGSSREQAAQKTPEAADERLARLLAEALRAQSDSRSDAPYVGPDLPDDILMRGWFDLTKGAKILAVAWPRPLPWRRRQLLLPLLVDALRHQADSRVDGPYIDAATPDDVLLDGWWDLEAALRHILAAMPPDVAPRRRGLHCFTGDRDPGGEAPVV